MLLRWIQNEIRSILNLKVQSRLAACSFCNVIRYTVTILTYSGQFGLLVVAIKSIVSSNFHYCNDDRLRWMLLLNVVMMARWNFLIREWKRILQEFCSKLHILGQCFLTTQFYCLSLLRSNRDMYLNVISDRQQTIFSFLHWSKFSIEKTYRSIDSTDWYCYGLYVLFLGQKWTLDFLSAFSYSLWSFIS